MKRLLLLLFAICLCSNSYAKERTKIFTIKQKGDVKTIIRCRGNFEKGVLSDGPVRLSYWGKRYNSSYLSSRDITFSTPDVRLKGIYRSDSTYTFWGTCTEMKHSTTISCYGTIINDTDNRTISKKSSAKNWKINLQFYAFIGDDPQIKAVFTRGKSSNLTWEQLRYLADYEGSVVVDSATVYFPDGCKYIGPIQYVYVYHDGTDGAKATKEWCIGGNTMISKYVWPNGDYFIGEANYNFKKDVNPLIIREYKNGCFHLVDGSTLDYEDYHKNYYVTKQDEYLKQYPYPSQLFPILKERKQNEEAEKQRKEQEEKLQREKERKLEQEARLKEEREQQAKAEQRRKLLIRKYGQKWGELLAQGKIELGMTKQMCQEVVNIEFYDISRSNYFGRIVETWMYDQEKLRMSSGGAFLGMALLEDFANAFGLQTPTVVQYTYLVFTDGKLTSIY